MLFPKSIATPALLAQITTAKFVDHVPLYRQETQFGRLRVFLGRATMAGWMIRLGATHVVPIINLLTDLLLEASLIHCDETRLQILNSDKSPLAIIGCGSEPPDHPAEGLSYLTMTRRAAAPYPGDCSRATAAFCSPTATKRAPRSHSPRTGPRGLYGPCAPSIR